jgi:hypothetical protein
VAGIIVSTLLPRITRLGDISLRSSLEKLSAGARVIFGVAALLENTPFELYTHPQRVVDPASGGDA